MKIQNSLKISTIITILPLIAMENPELQQTPCVRNFTKNHRGSTYTMGFEESNGLNKLNNDWHRRRLSAINSKFSYAAAHDHRNIVAWFLDLPARYRPSQYVVDNAYLEAARLTQVAMINLLKPHVTEQTHLGRKAAPSNGVHDYAKTMIEIGEDNSRKRIREKSSARHYSAAEHSYSSSTALKGRRLIDAVIEVMQTTVGNAQSPFDSSILPIGTTQQIIARAINQYIPNDQKDQAHQAVFEKIMFDDNGLVNFDYVAPLCLAVTFIQQLLPKHPEAMELWTDGFVKESIMAYNSSRVNSTSCTPGIRERIVMATRFIAHLNSDLKRLFAPAEDIEMMRKYLLSWNHSDNLQWVVKQLIKGGGCDSTDAQEAADIFRLVAGRKFSENRITITDDFLGDVNAYASAIFDCFEKSIKPELINTIAKANNSEPLSKKRRYG